MTARGLAPAGLPMRGSRARRWSMATWTDPKTYFHGLVAAVVSGIGGAISLVVVDGDKFNPFGKGSWKSLLAAVIVQALLAAGPTCDRARSCPLPRIPRSQRRARRRGSETADLRQHIERKAGTGGQPLRRIHSGGRGPRSPRLRYGLRFAMMSMSVRSGPLTSW